MKHIRPTTKELRLELAQSDPVCGWIFRRDNVKCFESDDPRARLLKQVPVA